MRTVVRQVGGTLAFVAIVGAFAYGVYGMATYAYPLWNNNFRGALKSRVTDPTEVFLNGAAKSYEEGKVDEARKVLERTLEKLVSKNGKFKEADKWKVERAHFMLGKCYQRQKKFDKAIQEYEATLRINPEHYPAKYNLEMLKMGGGGGGGGDGQGGGGQPGTDPGAKKKPKI